MADILALYSAGGGHGASGAIRNGATRIGRADRCGGTMVFYDHLDRRAGTAERVGSYVVIRDAAGRVVLRVRAA